MRARSSPLNSLLVRGLLAFALLFGQQTATLHWLSHALEATQAKATQTAPSEHCDECLALAGLGAAATATTTALPTTSAQHALIALPPCTVAPATRRLGFEPRAPPAFLS